MSEEIQDKKWTLKDIKRRNKETGHYFFSPAALSGFRSVMDKSLVFQGPGGLFFISSEQFSDSNDECDPRHYHVRQFHPEKGSIDDPKHPYAEKMKHPPMPHSGIKRIGFGGFFEKEAAVRYAERLINNWPLEPSVVFHRTGCIMDGSFGDEAINRKLKHLALEQGYLGDLSFGKDDGEFDNEIAEEIIEWLNEHCCAEHLYLQFENGGDLLCLHSEVDYDDPDKDEETQLEEWRAGGADLGDIDYAEEIKEEATTNCYYASAICDGRLWTCQTCLEKFCSDTHHHYTDKGTNVECVACERTRLENVVEDTESQDDGQQFIERWTEEGYGVAHVRYVNDPDDLTKVADTIVLQPYAEADKFIGHELKIIGSDAQLLNGTWLVLHSGILEELWQDQQKDQGRTK